MRKANGEPLLQISAPLLLALALTGCTTHVIPPPAPTNPVTVYLTDYGKHSSLLLPTDDGGFDEYAFGDWAYFAEGKTGMAMALRALLGSPQSTLGRRHIPPIPDLNHALGAKRLTAIAVPDSRADDLHAKLEARFRASDQSPYSSTYSSLDHIRDEEHYWAGNNCNHVTAAWLRQLGCEIKGPAIFSDFVVRPRRSRFEPAH